MEQRCGDRGDPVDRDRALDCLTDVFRCFLTGSRPGLGAADVARVILSGVCGPVRDQSGLDLSCISLTLVDKMSRSLTRNQPDRNQPDPAFSSFCREVLTVLLQDLDLMTELVQVFRTRDRILSHLAAKTASSCVFYQLLSAGSVSAAWQQKCVQTFHSSDPGPGPGSGRGLDPALDPCLWSLTEVLKRLLRGNHQDLVTRLLAPVDSALSVLVPWLLPERAGPGWGTTCCLLLDLLEALTASAGRGGAGVCVQRLTHTHCSALLDTVSGCSQASVRKRALLLLKRAVLQRAGEDWAVGDRRSTGTADGRTLARSVLAAVDSGWLQTVQVDSDSYFGGTRHVRGPDRVVLRAISLVLLRSLEVMAAHGSTQVSGYLHRLQVFLRLTGGHRCSWISRLFSDQDDDMMEAAKALLEIHLHRWRSGLEDCAGSACSSGSNPHCHFLLLLQSVSFDHGVLLDFLISTETCFLEYLVRYLKFLRGDAQGFAAACRRISCGGAVAEGTGTGALPLVDYGSSEDSDPEDMEVGGCGDALPGVASGQVSQEALRCLTELREVVTRLRGKNLFPYNPTSLLRLLDQVHKGPGPDLTGSTTDQVQI